MAGLPKKYAKMGFKRGWAEYKKTKGKRSTGTKMAKRKTSYKNVGTKQYNSFSKTFLGKVTKKAIPVVYGMTRNKINNAIATSAIGKQIPAFQLADEFTMLGINWGLTQFGARKNPIARRALQAIEDIELANVGEQLEDIWASSKTTGTGLFG